MNLAQFVHEENALALSPRGGLHDPGGVRIFLEFFDENNIVARENIGHRHNVHVDQVASLVAFCDGVAFLVHILAETLDVLDH